MEFIQSIFSLILRNARGNLDLIVLLASYYLISYLMKRRATSQGLDARKVGDLFFWVAVGAVAGGRLAYALPSMQNYLQYPLDLIFINTGMYFYGALAGGLAIGAWYSWRRKLPFWGVADLYGLFTPLMIALTSFGCLLQNTCYGRQASPPLGILFPGLTQHRYPSELYEGLLALLLFGALLWLSQRHPARGVLFFAFLLGYSVDRILVDPTRIDLGGQIGTVDPYISTAVALVAVLGLWLVMRRGRGYGLAMPGIRFVKRGAAK